MHLPHQDLGGLGNLYRTAVETTTVGIIDADTKTDRPYAGHDDLIWPDGVSYAPDGHMYVSAAQVSCAADLNGGTSYTTLPA